MNAAMNDLRALEGMSDPEQFADEIFGFHAQQAAEKALKAWIAALGVQYPLRHDLQLLLDTLAQHGADTEELEVLTELTSFAVQFRYETIEVDTEQLDRACWVKRIHVLFERVRLLL